MGSEDAYALAIGISNYRYLPPLPATRDAQDVASVLGDAAVGAYPRRNIRILLDGKATRAAILKELERLAARTRKTSTVFIYFSGHGGRARNSDRCYLMPVDGRSDRLAKTALSGRELSARLRAIRAAKLTVVLDCCRAAGLAEPKDVESPLVPELTGTMLAPLARGRGRAILAASGADGVAYVVPGERNGVFTRHLLDGLRGAARSGGGLVRVCDLFHYVQQHLAGAEHRQRPVFKAELEENYPVAFVRGGEERERPAPAAGEVAYDMLVRYRHSDRIDRKFVVDVVAPLLERLGLRVCLEDAGGHGGACPGRAERRRSPGIAPASARDVRQLRHRGWTGRIAILIRTSYRSASGIRSIALIDVTSEVVAAALRAAGSCRGRTSRRTPGRSRR